MGCDMVLALRRPVLGIRLDFDESELSLVTSTVQIPTELASSSAELSALPSRLRLLITGGVSENGGFRGRDKFRSFPLDSLLLGPCSGWKEKTGFSGVELGMLSGDGRGRSLRVELPDE